MKWIHLDCGPELLFSVFVGLTNLAICCWCLTSYLGLHDEDSSKIQLFSAGGKVERAFGAAKVRVTR